MLFRCTALGEPASLAEDRLLWGPLVALQRLAGGVPASELASIGVQLLGDALPQGSEVQLGPTERLVHRFGLS